MVKEITDNGEKISWKYRDLNLQRKEDRVSRDVKVG